jgi:hypothetical protein
VDHLHVKRTELVGFPYIVIEDYVVLDLGLYLGLDFLLRMHSPTHIGWCAAPFVGLPRTLSPPSEGFPPIHISCSRISPSYLLIYM